MANKFKVFGDNHFLGHYYGRTPKIAIQKAIKKSIINPTNFMLKKKLSDEPVYYTIKDLEEE